MDIITDLLTAIDFLSRGHFYWGILTILPICAPFIARVLMFIVGIFQCFKIQRSGVKEVNIPTQAIVFQDSFKVKSFQTTLQKL
jgi:hypothetical protein